MDNTRHERIHTSIHNDARSASQAVAADIASLIRDRQQDGKQVVLGLATGSTPKTLYQELIRLHKEEDLSFSNVVTFNLDEYYPLQPDAFQSYVRFMHEHLFAHIDIPRENIHIPDGTLAPGDVTAFCAEYEKAIEAAGGLDVQVLGIGQTGHIGFNEPGSAIDSATRMVTLTKITRKDAASAFFGEEHVPKRAITMGVGTIMKARKVYLLAWGEDKAGIVARAVEGAPSSSIPATFLQQHPNVEAVVDAAAAAQLTRVQAPWTVGACDWAAGGDRLVRKAVTWLSQRIGKPILKLTEDEYMEHGMGDLITLQGESSYNINIRVFKQMQNTITGWPGGKPNCDDSTRPERAAPHPKRVLIFSPHPDDDVISMGGTLCRLIDQGHDVHVAYQTSGSIAVPDDDAIRFLDFANDLARDFGGGAEELDHVGSMYKRVRHFLTSKHHGQIDTQEVLRIKGLIRVGEARAACRYVGVPDSNVHFLNMPFYDTGMVKKKPLSSEDTAIVVDVLRKVKPHQVFAAGDLSDPHGTHRTCLAAVLQALEHVADDDWMADCRTWMYRGAWQEWPVDEIEMAVPLSPDELMRKKRAIWKHQSQKDRPLFPGIDDREFWQRAEARNRQTAALYDALGLPEYDAMEAFVRYRMGKPGAASSLLH